MQFRYLCQLINQTIAVLIIKLLVLPWCKRDLTPFAARPLHEGPYLIAANHRRGVDPFVISTSLRYRDFLQLAPIGFMTKNAFYSTPLKPLAWLYGCYPARQARSPFYGVEGSIKLLENNFSLLVFPQGKCAKRGERLPAHSGITRIHQAKPHVPMLLCHIEYHGLKALFRRQLFTVGFRVIEHAQYTDPEQLMDDIFAIPTPFTK